MSEAPLSRRVPLSSASLPAGAGLAGSARLIIWTPWSVSEATAAWVVSSETNVVILRAPSSKSPPAPSVSASWPAGAGLARSVPPESVRLSIWTPWSMDEATAAWVVVPETNVVMPMAPSSKISLVPSVSASLPATTGLARSVPLESVRRSIWTPSSVAEATAA